MVFSFGDASSQSWPELPSDMQAPVHVTPHGLLGLNGFGPGSQDNTFDHQLSAMSGMGGMGGLSGGAGLNPWSWNPQASEADRQQQQQQQADQHQHMMQLFQQMGGVGDDGSQRIEELGHYIRQQARDEVHRLHQVMQDGSSSAGKDASANDSASEPSRVSAPWSPSTVSTEDFQQVHRKWTAAEDRIQELEQYIKEQSASHAANIQAKLKERDEELRQVRAALLQSNLDLQQAREESQSFRAAHQQKVLFWEHGAHHLLAMVEQFQSAQAGGFRREREELGAGRFGREATKLSLTLPLQAEGSDVGSLCRQLKDVLKNNSGKEQTTKKPSQKGGADETADSPRPEEGKESKEGKSVTPVEGAAEEEEGKEVPASSAAESTAQAKRGNSNPSSRDTTPSRTPDTAAARASEAAKHFVSQLACNLRHLLVMSQRAAGNPGPVLSGSPSQDSSPRSVGSSGPSAEQRRVRQCIDSIPPVRQGIAKNIMDVEKMLRGLDLDLKRQCEELFGVPELPKGTDDSTRPRADSVSGAAAEAEARKLVPVAEDMQLLVLVGFRSAQQRLAAALVEFLQLPQKLKMVFDLTKTLGAEVDSLMPISAFRQVAS